MGLQPSETYSAGYVHTACYGTHASHDHNLQGSKWREALEQAHRQQSDLIVV